MTKKYRNESANVMTFLEMMILGQEVICDGGLGRIVKKDPTFITIRTYSNNKIRKYSIEYVRLIPVNFQDSFGLKDVVVKRPPPPPAPPLPPKIVRIRSIFGNE